MPHRLPEQSLPAGKPATTGRPRGKRAAVDEVLTQGVGIPVVGVRAGCPARRHEGTSEVSTTEVSVNLGTGAFAASQAVFTSTLDWLDGAGAAELDHAQLETYLQGVGRELMLALFQDSMDLRAVRERLRTEVVDADEVARTRIESGHTRALTTVFGEVSVSRKAYRAPQQTNLYPADGLLNLPGEKHSHGLRRLAAIEATRGSFDDTVAAIDRNTGVALGKRQVEQLAVAAAVDFNDFYNQRTPPVPDPGEDPERQPVLVCSVDGKGIVMRPDALRPATAKAAATTTTKLATRLSRGEKRGRKRMAEVGAVYQVKPVVRTAADILAHSDGDQPRPKAPVAAGKWLTASVVEDTATVIAAVFDEADRRDPDHLLTRLALVDGNNHQIERITAEAAKRGTGITIIVDFIHVLEYLWKAAWCFHDEGDPAAETWVADKATAILEGNARRVAAGIRRSATARGLPESKRAAADTCADYLTTKAPYLDYPQALASGWPIATGVIEGACRHLVKDRLDITGARWGLTSAESILKLRALHANGDFDAYWQYHLDREHYRIHRTRYLNGHIPAAA
jgi:hypothetical protein